MLTEWSGSSPAGEPCRKVLVSASDIDNMVLSALGVGKGLTCSEEQAAVRAAIRQIVYDASTAKVEVEFQAGARDPAGCYSR